MSPTTTALLGHAHALRTVPLTVLHHRKKLLLSVMALGAHFLRTFRANSHVKVKRIPMYTSVGKGEEWISNILAGHPHQCLDNLGMGKAIFRALLQHLEVHSGLQSGRLIGTAEQLAIFLYTIRTGVSICIAAEWFQHSKSTISKYIIGHFLCGDGSSLISLISFNTRYIHIILNKLVAQSFYSAFVRLPPASTPSNIQDNPCFFPFFEGCIGAIDGTHFSVFVPSSSDTARYRDRKSVLTQNVLAACSFEAEFVYVMSGWEGSAADSQVFDDARHTDFKVPQGFYYLADAGFPICDALLVPYRGKRYHLREWEISNER